MRITEVKKVISYTTGAIRIRRYWVDWIQGEMDYRCKEYANAKTQEVAYQRILKQSV